MRDYDEYLTNPVKMEELSEVCNSIFKYGNFERLPEIVPLILPIANIVYYQSILRYDDRYYAREDLIQDAVLSIYTDMKLHWDKYIHVDNYYEYIKRTIHLLMLESVHMYHNYYSTEEYDPTKLDRGAPNVQNYVDMKISLSSLESDILDETWKLLSHRKHRLPMMKDLFGALYHDKDKNRLDHLYSMYKGVGVGPTLMRFYEGRVKYLYSIVREERLRNLKEGDTLKTYEDLVSRICSDEYEILSLLYGDSVIPEIYAEFGMDVLLRLSKLYGGTTIKIPDSRDLGDTLLGSTVYHLAEGNRDNLQSVSTIHGYPLSTLTRIFDKYISDMQRKESYRKKYE